MRASITTTKTRRVHCAGSAHNAKQPDASMSLKKKLRRKPGFDALLRIGPALRARRDVCRRLDQFAVLMAPGTYTLRWNLASRDLAPGESASEIRTGFLEHNNIDRHFAYRLAEALPPRGRAIARADGAADAPDAGDVLLVRGEATLLLTRDGRHIIRLFPTAALAERILDNAEQLRGWLRIPSVEPLATDVQGLHGIRESLMPGTMVKLGNPEQNAAGYRDFLGQCLDHAPAATGTFGREDEVRKVLGWPLPPWLRQALNADAECLVETLTHAPMLFSHGDCHPGNLIIGADGRAGMIDLERAEWMPFFFDALYMLRSQHPSCIDLRQRYLAGDFDDVLARIWTAAGREFRPDLRMTYLLTVSVAHALRSQYQAKTTPKRARKLLNSSRSLRGDCASAD